MDPMWAYKARIGAAGGIALVLLKLIEARFFVIDVASKDAIAAYLTYLAYVILGVMVSTYFTDSDATGDKLRKNAFVLGLLAPSLLLALTTQPVKRELSVEDTLKKIPRLGLLAEPAYAQEGGPVKTQTPPAPPAAPTGLAVEQRVLTKEEVEPTFKASFWKALGRDIESSQYLYVLGTTTDKARAVKAAEQVNAILSTKDQLKASVIRPEGKGNLFLVLDKPGSAAKATEINAAAKAAALAALKKDNKPETIGAAALLLEGEVVKARVLFE